MSRAGGGDVPVTRHFSPKTGTVHGKPLLSSVVQYPRERRFEQSESFCDWVSIYQRHEAGDLPKINDGAFVRYDADGVHECTTLKKAKIEGSHSTGVMIRCDGQTVWFEGNVSKFGRLDNVFGFSFCECVARINAILGTLGLPPFTDGTAFRSQSSDKLCFTGARITRLDLTQNFMSGSAGNASVFMRHLAMQQASRLKTGTYGEGETVDFGRGSRRVYSKAYVKNVELLKHMARKQKGPETDFSRVVDPYVQNLADWCASVGLVRWETTYKSTFLIDANQNYLGGLDMRHLEKDFVQRQEVFTRANCEVEELASLDKKTLGAYRMWQAGDDLTAKCSRSSFYRFRSALLPYGVDIAVKSNVISFQPRVRVIKLAPASMPSFYQLPAPVSNLRLAA